MKRTLIALLLVASPALVLPGLSAAPPATAPATIPATVPSSAVETAPASSPVPATATTPATAAAAIPASPALPAESRFTRGGNRSLPAEYEVLNRKSIFAKDRRSRSNESRFPREPRTTTRLPATPVFIGTVLEDDGFVGFIENPDTGQLTQVHAGDKLPNGAGSVVGITLDYLEIAAGGETPSAPPKRIVVGQTLLGAAPTVASTEPGAGGGEEAATTSTAPATAGSPDSLIERLRRRRQQELGK